MAASGSTQVAKLLVENGALVNPPVPANEHYVSAPSECRVCYTTCNDKVCKQQTCPVKKSINATHAIILFCFVLSSLLTFSYTYIQTIYVYCLVDLPRNETWKRVQEYNVAFIRKNNLLIKIHTLVKNFDFCNSSVQDRN